jgi:ubiquinone/menaquinone biosynthesis C-methylase UbiE
MYNTRSGAEWDVGAVTGVVDLEGKVVIDAGAGTGRVAFAVAPYARHVFAFEPVATLRRSMRDKAARAGIDNVYVADGLLHSIPLPAAGADVLLTCQAIGWSLDAELTEIERVVRPGGVALHLFDTPEAAPADGPLFGALVANGYEHDVFRSGAATMHRYQKRIGA